MSSESTATMVKPELNGSIINCLDKGYVRLVDTMGSDLSVVNAARVSYDKESHELEDRDRRLINFLLREGHHSPFRHAGLTFEVYSPLFVARQHWKYVVASTHTEDQNGWNESSRRYITEEPVFHIPGIGEWRQKPENSKQGSGDFFSEGMGIHFTKRLEYIIDMCLREYEDALDKGVAPEQARLFLASYGMYVRYRWTVSLAGVLHFLMQRLEHDAQAEIRVYAQAVRELAEPLFPATFNAFLGE